MLLGFMDAIKTQNLGARVVVILKLTVLSPQQNISDIQNQKNKVCVEKSIIKKIILIKVL